MSGDTGEGGGVMFLSDDGEDMVMVKIQRGR